MPSALMIVNGEVVEGIRTVTFCDKVADLERLPRVAVTEQHFASLTKAELTQVIMSLFEKRAFLGNITKDTASVVCVGTQWIYLLPKLCI